MQVHKPSCALRVILTKVPDLSELQRMLCDDSMCACLTPVTLRWAFNLYAPQVRWITEKTLGAYRLRILVTIHTSSVSNGCSWNSEICWFHAVNRTNQKVQLFGRIFVRCLCCDVYWLIRCGRNYVFTMQTHE